MSFETARPLSHGQAPAAVDAAGPLANRRWSLSRQEISLLAWALCIAFFAVAISYASRAAPETRVDVLILGGIIFALGTGAGIAAIVAARLIPRTATTTIAATPKTHLDHIFVHSPNGIAIWDQYGHLIRANEKYATMLQLTAPDDIIGAPRTMIETGLGKPLSAIIGGKDGAIRAGPRCIYPMKRTLPSGEMIETLLDVTALKQREQAIIKYEEEAKTLVQEFGQIRQDAERMADEISHLESALSAERERADSAMRAKTDFLSHMSHELRTPLNAIIGFAELMKAQTYGPIGHPKYVEYAEDIYDSGEALLRQISDILDVSQTQTGDLPVDRQRIDLEPIIESVLENIRPKLFTSTITLMEDIGQLPTVFADQLAARQMISTMMNNAMKHTPKNGRISIKSECDLNNVTIIVDDTGIGIPADVLASIDEPLAYTQEDPEISRSNYGLGIGLAVAKSLARINGGCLTIDSEQGYGTTVRLSLPRR